ncbi:MAG: leucine-rich repeat protein [Clostridia bacterium]|nr:leucine-rich repeat protein [Clostridia bacterium]
MQETNAQWQDDFVKMDLNSYEGNEPYIFISYSHRDSQEVYRILKMIDREKFRFWYDDTMEIGEDFREELRVRIENCSAFLLFLSNSALQSKYCGMEIITAYKNNKKIYPIYLSDDVEIPPALKMILENLQHVKGVNAGSDKYIQKLISGLPIETMRSLEVEDGVLLKCKDGSNHLSVPSGVKVIGEGAFKNCVKLEKLDIGDEVQELRKEACRGCKELEYVYLPQNVRKVGESAFRDCISLTKLVVENDDIELGERAFENCANLVDVSLNDEMTEIYGGVFNSCKALVDIKLPKKLTILGESSFADCASLKSIDIPQFVTKIDDMVFNGCVELENIDMKNNITKIGKNAFKDCKSLKSITIPMSVTNIGSGPFRGCGKLESILVDPKNKWFKSLDGVLFNKNKSTLICYPCQIDATTYEVPDSVTVISDWAFCECSHLQSVTIPDSVVEIGEGAFYACTSIEEIVLPDSVNKIDDTAFRGCTSLKKVVIPDSVHDFGWGLFNGCEGVTIVCSDNSDAARYCDIRDIPHHA